MVSDKNPSMGNIPLASNICSCGGRPGIVDRPGVELRTEARTLMYSSLAALHSGEMSPSKGVIQANWS